MSRNFLATPLSTNRSGLVRQSGQDLSKEDLMLLEEQWQRLEAEREVREQSRRDRIATQSTMSEVEKERQDKERADRGDESDSATVESQNSEHDSDYDDISGNPANYSSSLTSEAYGRNERRVYKAMHLMTSKEKNAPRCDAVDKKPWIEFKSKYDAFYRTNGIQLQQELMDVDTIGFYCFVLEFEEKDFMKLKSVTLRQYIDEYHGIKQIDDYKKTLTDLNMKDHDTEYHPEKIAQYEKAFIGEIKRKPHFKKSASGEGPDATQEQLAEIMIDGLQPKYPGGVKKPVEKTAPKNPEKAGDNVVTKPICTL